MFDDDADTNVGASSGADDGGTACAKLQRCNGGVGDIIHSAAAASFLAAADDDDDDEDGATADAAENDDNATGADDDVDATDASDNEPVDSDADTNSGSVDASSENLVFVPSLHSAHEKRELGFSCSHLSHFQWLLIEGSSIISKVSESR